VTAVSGQFSDAEYRFMDTILHNGAYAVNPQTIVFACAPRKRARCAHPTSPCFRNSDETSRRSPSGSKLDRARPSAFERPWPPLAAVRRCEGWLRRQANMGDLIKLRWDGFGRGDHLRRQLVAYDIDNNSPVASMRRRQILWAEWISHHPPRPMAGKRRRDPYSTLVP
jgi:hypothetical protein